MDYTVGSKTLTLDAGATSVTTTVTATGDTEVEGTETVTVVASHAIEELGTRDRAGSADIQITDDDEASFSLSVSPATIAEGTSATVTVSTGGCDVFDGADDHVGCERQHGGGVGLHAVRGESDDCGGGDFGHGHGDGGGRQRGGG